MEINLAVNKVYNLFSYLPRKNGFDQGDFFGNACDPFDAGVFKRCCLFSWEASSRLFSIIDDDSTVGTISDGELSAWSFSIDV